MYKRFECSNYQVLGMLLDSFENRNDYSKKALIVRERFARLGDKYIAEVKCIGKKLPKIWQSFVYEIERNKNFAENSIVITSVPERVIGFESVEDMGLAFRYYNDLDVLWIDVPENFEKIRCYVFDKNGVKRKSNLIVPIIPEHPCFNNLESAFWERVRSAPRLRELLVEGTEIC